MAETETTYAPIFRFVPVLYPAALRILLAHGLDGPNFFMLSYLKHFGRHTSEGVGLLHGEFLRVVGQAFDHEDTTGPSKKVTQLCNRGLLQKRGITRDFRQAWFPEHARGSHLTLLAITPAGLTLLERVNEDACRLIEHLLGDGAARRYVAKSLIKRLNEMMPELVRRADDWKMNDEAVTP